MASSTTRKSTFSGYQKLIIALMAFLQFTIILDFMIMSPLGAIIMPTMKITPAQFGVAVSVYAFSAGISGILAAGFADRYDRKKLLVLFYSGFLLGTLFCGLATSYHFLLFARMVAGIFGGVLGSVIYAIVTDIFPLDIRGRVMGVIQTAFAASQILGLPAGIFLSNHWGWHAPFLVIVAVGLLVGVVLISKMQPVDAHLAYKTERSPFAHLQATVMNPRYRIAFLTTGLLSIGGFMLMPFASAYTANNLGIPLSDLPLIYLVSGLSTIAIAPLVGRLTDVYGHLKVFTAGTLLSLITVPIYTHMGVSPLWAVITINVIMFAGVFSRMIPSQTLMSALPAPASRGAFMALGSSLQQMAGGLASVIAGLIVTQDGAGHIQHFDIIGYILMATALFSVYMLYRVHRVVEIQKAEASA